MKNKELYDKTVGILVDAYFNDTLESGNCAACACGNLVAANNGYKIVNIANKSVWLDPDGFYHKPTWVNVIGTHTEHWLTIPIRKIQYSHIGKYNSEVKSEVESTGYMLHEFALIENAFEVGYRGRDKMFNGLMAVIEVLDKIHENNDAALTIQTKSRFCKQVA